MALFPEALPCPFCGSKNVRKRKWPSGEELAFCCDCDANTPLAVWQRRAGDKDRWRTDFDKEPMPTSGPFRVWLSDDDLQEERVAEIRDGKFGLIGGEDDPEQWALDHFFLPHGLIAGWRPEAYGPY